MAGKPIDQHPGGVIPRERVWAAIRGWPAAKGPFSLREIADAAKVHPATTSDYLRALTAGGWLIRETLDGKPFWRLGRDTGRETPRVRNDGTPVVQGSAQENMWRSMRLLGTFTVSDLIANAATEDAPIDPDTAKKYVLALADAGYVLAAGGAWYHFVRAMHTGPKAPAIQRSKVVFDQNLRRVMWSAAGGRHDADR